MIIPLVSTEFQNIYPARGRKQMASTSTLCARSFKIFTPQGDGNLNQMGVVVQNKTVSKYLPRKGTETVICFKKTLSFHMFQNIYPARGRKLDFKLRNNYYLTFQNIYPARGRKPIAEAELISRKLVSKYLPRKGTETIMESNTPQDRSFVIKFQNIYPARGRKLFQHNLLKQILRFQNIYPARGRKLRHNSVAVSIVFQNIYPARGRKRFLQGKKNY